jgi:shikimate kinase
MSLIYIAGLSGSGKSTITKLLRKKGYEAHDADNELCKWFDNETDKEVVYPRDSANRAPTWQEQHSFRMSEELIADIARRSNDEPVFILGIVTNDLDLAQVYFDKVYFLYVSEDEMVHRVTTRTTNKYGHDPDQLAVIKKWYQPTIDKYKNYSASFIDAEQPVERVVEKILQTTTNNKDRGSGYLRELEL